MEINTTQPTESSITPSTEKRHVSVAKIILWVVAILVLAIVVFGVGIYRLGWKGKFVLAVENIIPYPAAMVEGRIISRGDVNERFTAYQHAIEQSQNIDFSDPANAEILNEQRMALFNRLIDLKFEEVLAGKMDIEVTDADIDQEFSRVTEQTGYEGNALDELILNMYGWNRSQFTDYV
jgi:hypothetical protein